MDSDMVASADGDDSSMSGDGARRPQSKKGNQKKKGNKKASNNKRAKKSPKESSTDLTTKVTAPCYALVNLNS